jgi:hypothetical protein
MPMLAWKRIMVSRLVLQSTENVPFHVGERNHSSYWWREIRASIKVGSERTTDALQTRSMLVRLGGTFWLPPMAVTCERQSRSVDLLVSALVGQSEVFRSRLYVSAGASRGSEGRQRNYRESSMKDTISSGEDTVKNAETPHPDGGTAGRNSRKKANLVSKLIAAAIGFVIMTALALLLLLTWTGILLGLRNIAGWP